MKRTTILWLAAVWAAVCSLQAASTAFTYQGRLAAGGAPANGAYDFQFGLWDSVANGNPVGLPFAAPGIWVTGGVFTASLDFGATPFSGTGLWLEISVAPAGSGAYTALAPRQGLAPGPLAIHAASADTVVTVRWSALPGPVLTNADAFQPASPGLTNLANGDGSQLTNLSANAIGGNFAGVSWPVPVTWIPTNTPLEEMGNAGAMPYGSNLGAGLVELMTNTFILTNITAGFSATAGSLYSTGAVVKIWQVASPTNLHFQFDSPALATNPMVVFPGGVPYKAAPSLTSISFPPTLVTNGGWLVVAAVSTNYAQNAIQVNEWFQDAANTNNPRPLVLTISPSGVVEPYNAAVANYSYGGAGYRAYGYMTQVATNLATYLNAFAGTITAPIVTNAASLSYSTNLSNLPITNQTVQSALDYEATTQHLPLALANYPDRSRVFLFDGDSRSSPATGPLQWAQRWLTNYPFFSRAQIIPLGHGGTGPWDCVTNYPLYVHPWGSTAGPYDVYYSIYTGVNNLTNVAYSWSNYVWCVQQATNDGIKPIMWTLAGNSGWTPNMIQFNQLVRSNYRSYGAILMEPDVLFPQSPNTAWYYDGEHPTTNAMIQICAQLDAAVRGNNGVTTLTPITNTWALLSSPGGLPLSLGVGGGVTNVALAITASNTVSIPGGLSVAGPVYLNGGTLVGNGAGLTNLTPAGTLTNNISGSAAYATNAGTATNVPWSALPGPVLTNATPFQPASPGLTNLANGDGSQLNILNANAITGAFSGSFLIASGFSNTLAECSGNAAFSSLCGGGFAQLMTNSFTFTNVQATVGGTISPTQAYFFVFSLPTYASGFNPWRTTALYSNTVALPAYSPGMVTSFPVPALQATAGNTLVAVWIPTSLSNNAVKFACWQSDAGNTNLPRAQMPYYYSLGSDVLLGTYPVYGSAGMILSGYASQPVTNFTTYLAYLAAGSGGAGGGGAANAGQLAYSNALSGLFGGTVQSAIDQLAGEAAAAAAYDAALGVQIPRIILADSYAAVVGDDLQMFARGIIEAENPYNLPYQLTCSRGAVYPRYFDYTAAPPDTNLGPLTLTVSVTDLAGQTVIATGSTTIEVVAANHGPGSNIIVACLGDSLTDAGVWPAECYRRLTQPGGSPLGKGWGNIQFVGDRPMAGYPSQGFTGWGGWQWLTYTNTATNSAAWLVVPGHDKSAVDIGSYWYDSGSNKWRLMAVAGNALKLGYNGGVISNLGASGTLAYDAADGGGTHTSGISYTSVSPTILSPLNNTNGFSFAGFSGLVGATNLSVVYVLLGWNGLPGPNYAYASNHLAFQNEAQVFINQLRSDFPNALVRIVGMEVPSPSGGLGANYGATGTYAQYYPLLRTLNGVRLAYQQLCDLPGNSGFCRFVDVAPQFDSEYNMQTGLAPVNSRNSTTEVRGTNGIHPATSGYYQIADAVYRDFVRTFCQ